MYNVVIEELCSCAKKSMTEQIRTFDTQDEAEDHAYEWADTLNNRFCGKHGFDVKAVNEHFIISVEEGGFCESCEL